MARVDGMDIQMLINPARPSAMLFLYGGEIRDRSHET
jgi:hypothetical protein